MDHIIMHVSEEGLINFTNEEGDPVNIRVSKVSSLNPWMDSVTEKRVKPGDKMPDGTVYVGLSPDTGRPLYTTDHDQGCYSWVDVEYVAKDMREYNHDDWRLPSLKELELLYKKKDMGCLQDSFNTDGEYYWSSDEDLNFLSKVKRFSDGGRGHSFKKMERMLRCVRSDESVTATGGYHLKVDTPATDKRAPEKVAAKVKSPVRDVKKTVPEALSENV